VNDPEDERPVIVSACLVGLATRYDGRAARSSEALRLAGDAPLVPVCPEQLGGLATPRPRSRIESGSGDGVLEGRARVTNDAGVDVTENYLSGARAVLEIARLVGARVAVLKEKSPSCGVASLASADGSRPGRGVTAALLAREGIEVKGV